MCEVALDLQHREVLDGSGGEGGLQQGVDRPGAVAAGALRRAGQAAGEPEEGEVVREQSASGVRPVDMNSSEGGVAACRGLLGRVAVMRPPRRPAPPGGEVYGDVPRPKADRTQKTLISDKIRATPGLGCP